MVALCVLVASWADGFRPSFVKRGLPSRRFLQQSNGRLECQWSDEIGCFLDYFDIIPPSEIKDVYILDENCRGATNQENCTEMEDCSWFDVECGARLEEKINECEKLEGALEPGSFCTFAEEVIRCADLKEGNCTAAGCELAMDGSCIISDGKLIELEFATSPERLAEVKNVSMMCNTSRNITECESG